MKGKKLLAGLLSAAMVLGTMVMPAFAETDKLPEAVDGTITLTENVTLTSAVTITDNIDLNGFDLTLAGGTYVYNDIKGENIVIENGDIFVPNTANITDSILAIGGYSSMSGNSVTVKHVNVYADDCKIALGLFGVYGKNELTLDTVHVEANIDGQVGAIVYGNTQTQKATLKDVTVNLSKCNNMISGIQYADIDNLSFNGKVGEYVFSVVGGTIKNSSITLTNEADDEIEAVWRDYKNAHIREFNIVDTEINNIPPCKNGAFEVNNEASAVVTDPASSFTDTDNKAVAADDVKIAVAKVNDKLYTSFADAVANAEDGDTVTLLQDASGDAVAVKENKFPEQGLTLELNDHTYTVSGTLVGSDTTETNAFHFLQGNKITVKNGTLTSSENAPRGNCEHPGNGAFILIQNYSDLTLENVTVDGSNLAKHPTEDYFPIALANNNGISKLKNSTVKGGQYGNALDIDRTNGYEKSELTVENTVIEGMINVWGADNASLIDAGNENAVITEAGKYYQENGKITAPAARSLNVKASKTTVKAGDTFDVRVSIVGEDLTNASYTLTYETDKFMLTNGSNTGVIKETLVHSGSMNEVYTDGEVVATYTFKALSQSESTIGEFVLSDAEAYTYIESGRGYKFPAECNKASVTIALSDFDVTVKVDGEALTDTEKEANEKTIAWDGKKHSVVIDVQPSDYDKIEYYLVNGDGDDATETLLTNIAFADKGTYVIKYVVKSAEGYNELTGKFTLVITSPAYYVEVNTGSDKADYISGKKLVLVYTDTDGCSFTYSEDSVAYDMVDVTKNVKGYKFEQNADDENVTTQTVFKHVYAFVTDGIKGGTYADYKANVSEKIPASKNIQKIDAYSNDVNSANGVEFTDVSAVFGVYGGYDGYYNNRSEFVKLILKADVNGDKRVTGTDGARVALEAFGK